MKPFVLFCVLCASTATAQNLNSIGGFSGGAYEGRSTPQEIAKRNAELHRHPFRKVEGRYYGLGPLFAAPPRGLGLLPKEYAGWTVLESLRVSQANPDSGGILGNHYHYKTIYLKNYPAKGLIDGAEIRCYAKEVGTFTYTDAHNVKRTVRAFDYGIPYDPKAITTLETNSLKRASAATNQLRFKVAPPAKPTK